MNGLYDHPDAPAVRYYDLYTQFQNIDLDFWVEEATRADGPVLELACGNGRLLLPLARAGVTIAGLDLSPGMLDAARRKLAAEPDDVRQRVTLVEGSMADFSLAERFNLIFVAFNSFYLLDDDGQQQALQTIRRHLTDRGRLILSLFDPNLPIIAHFLGQNAGVMTKRDTFEDPTTGHTIVQWETRNYDVAAQTVNGSFIFEELDGQGRSLTRTVQYLRLRYRYRYEMEYLLQLNGYRVEALYGGFERGPFEAGGSGVWVCRPA